MSEGFNVETGGERSGHVTERSPEYQAYIARIEELKPRLLSRGVFGRAELSLIRLTEELMGSLKDEEQTERTIREIEECKTNIEKYVTAIRSHLEEMEKTDLLSFHWFFKKIINDPELSEDFQKFKSPEIKEDKFYLHIGIRLYDKDSISNELFRKMVESYVRSFEKESEEFDMNLPEMTSQFKLQAIKAIEDGWLPITVEELEQRISETTPHLVDSLNYESGCASGDHNVVTGEIRIAYRTSPEDRPHTLAHEYMHALSGRTILKKAGAKSPVERISHQRSGLEFYGEGERENKFRWLNEAVTESITTRIDSNTSNFPAYKRERQVLENLIASGIPEGVIYDAYFENYDPDSSQRISSWKKLVERINKIFPEGLSILTDVEKGLAEEQRLMDQEIDEIKRVIISKRSSVQS